MHTRIFDDVLFNKCYVRLCNDKGFHRFSPPLIRNTDNGNIILDVSELNMGSVAAMETAINQIPGVVSNGLFALQGADVLLMDKGNEIQEITTSQA